MLGFWFLAYFKPLLAILWVKPAEAHGRLRQDARQPGEGEQQ